MQSALEEYDLQMDAMEEKLARLLRDKLTACQVSHGAVWRVLFSYHCFRLPLSLRVDFHFRL